MLKIHCLLCDEPCAIEKDPKALNRGGRHLYADRETNKKIFVEDNYMLYICFIKYFIGASNLTGSSLDLKS